MSEIKVYNAFDAVSDKNPNMKKEKFTKKSLVDPLEKVPTLKEYVNRYVATGDISVLPFRNDPVDELLPGEDEEDFSSPLYDKDADYDDIIEASKVPGVDDLKELLDKAEIAERSKKVLKNKFSKDTTEKKESNSQTNPVSENNNQETVE